MTATNGTGRGRVLIVTAVIASGLILTPVFAELHAKSEGAVRESGTHYMPEYTANGDLILPKNFEKWVYLGSPLTPNGLNGGKANFPEFHNVYMQPWAYEEYRKTNVFPEGTIMFKELQLTIPGQFPDGSRTEPSGRGYFPGKLNGADVTVKDSKRYVDTGGWGYYNFHHYEPKAATATLKPKTECAYCHSASAKKDEVWTQFDVRLDD